MLTIPGNDHGALYILELSGPVPDGLADKTDAALQALLGPVLINSDYVDVITPDLLTELDLPDLIRNGYDLPMSDTDTQKLRGLAGTVVVLMSAAFGGAAQAISLPDNVHLVATLRQTPELTHLQPIRTATAQGVLEGGRAKKRVSDAAMSGRIATIALVLMFALVGLMIWIAG